MHKRKKVSQEEASCDLTPMIDVVFQLIIFFIVTANLDQQSIKEDIILPDAPNAIRQKKKHPNQITVQVDGSGDVFIGGGPPFTIRELKQTLRSAVNTAGADNIPVLIRGDKTTRHRAIRKVMDACAEVGIYKIRFAGMQIEGSG